MITNHTQLLNALITKYGLKSYLEIGVQNKANNFNKILCPVKVGVDPEVNDSEIQGMTSDAYFEAIKNNNPQPVFDLIFIDGLHHAGQVKRDFENSLKYLSDDGFILIHDCLPENEAGAAVPRETKAWWGDVYKFCMGLGSYDGIRFKTFDIDNGCCLVWKDKEAIGGYEHKDIDWNYYQLFGRKLMNVQDAVTI